MLKSGRERVGNALYVVVAWIGSFFEGWVDDTNYLVLTILEAKPLDTGEIFQVLGANGNRWHPFDVSAAGMRALLTLEDQGFIIEDGTRYVFWGRIPVTVYSITDSGRAELARKRAEEDAAVHAQASA